MDILAWHGNTIETYEENIDYILELLENINVQSTPFIVRQRLVEGLAKISISGLADQPTDVAILSALIKLYFGRVEGVSGELKTTLLSYFNQFAKRRQNTGGLDILKQSFALALTLADTDLMLMIQFYQWMFKLMQGNSDRWVLIRRLAVELLANNKRAMQLCRLFTAIRFDNKADLQAPYISELVYLFDKLLLAIKTKVANGQIKRYKEYLISLLPADLLDSYQLDQEKQDEIDEEIESYIAELEGEPKKKTKKNDSKKKKTTNSVVVKAETPKKKKRDIDEEEEDDSDESEEEISDKDSESETSESVEDESSEEEEESETDPKEIVKSIARLSISKKVQQPKKEDSDSEEEEDSDTEVVDRTPTKFRRVVSSEEESEEEEEEEEDDEDDVEDSQDSDEGVVVVKRKIPIKNNSNTVEISDDESESEVEKSDSEDKDEDDNTDNSEGEEEEKEEESEDEQIENFKRLSINNNKNNNNNNNNNRNDQSNSRRKSTSKNQSDEESEEDDDEDGVEDLSEEEVDSDITSDDMQDLDDDSSYLTEDSDSDSDDISDD
ncbi:hypothetical protein PPL_09478 [Heterostelium album PN500]|uniref:Uncharacterized protein n=1 Tax=Heterostelium pallidum (strain ATCC 26659 / Pp 5 / PN500) TaxID=670386 RepID=D3BPK9_HETP5|nr:hypothetical protein PPL_09478 [Heterostelium album PN500]EFA76727.1 hypothetical protein PPL_09478 [Heterostelium album PN500]|eukprot:XP_020428859.1 hypothetical protein PPL_09478 [Heterostelium album PN500]